ncbi:hypothetical protein RJ639_036441 [Escallonia herrerae]|uniref:C2 domain-containing protein n=1 Tax=Escallonia herrerae TaxID=1293975 RepID=A0AA88WR09_9ASTE|nr:hypothetical protein RJ639_036441 [Escallonia herrerae]
MKVYARISLGNNPNTEKETSIDQHGKKNPTWNYSMSYAIKESTEQHHGTMVVIKLYSKRKLGDWYIGEVHASMKELYDIARSCGGSAVWSFSVQEGCVKSQVRSTSSPPQSQKPDTCPFIATRHRSHASVPSPENATFSGHQTVADPQRMPEQTSATIRNSKLDTFRSPAQPPTVHLEHHRP